MKKADFIEKARAIHGNKYDYSLIPEEFRGIDRIPLICDIHGEFVSIARNHIHGVHSGCPICGRKRAKSKITDTFESFVEKARKIHGDKYEYFENCFTKTASKLKIYCKKCGKVFEQMGTMHLAGNGCSFCNPPHTKLTHEKFVQKMSETHPNLEILSRYISTNKPIEVRCKIHDYKYTTTPHRLVQGSNCQKCYDERRGESLKKTTLQLLSELEKIHGSKYTYPKLENEYVNNKNKVTAVCPIHGEFKISVNKLLIGHGCRKCADIENGLKKRLTLEEVLYRFKKIHNNKYTYPYIKEEYETVNSIITVICPVHGEYKQKVGVHLSGCGCPICNESQLEKYVYSIIGECDRQYKPDWLGRKSLDFYIEGKRVGIECQGLQHFISVDRFGGEEGFKKRKALDISKFVACNEQHVSLIYVVSKKHKRYLTQKQFAGIYDKNVLFFEDIQKDNNILLEKIEELSCIR